MTTNIYIIEFQATGGQWLPASTLDGIECIFLDRDRALEVAHDLAPQVDVGQLRVTEFHRGQSRVVE